MGNNRQPDKNSLENLEINRPISLSDTLKKWILAARLRTLPLSLSGVILGSFLANAEGFWSPVVFGLAALTTVLFQVLSNLANDYGDGVKGTDNQRIGESRAVASGAITATQMKRAVWVLSGLSAASALLLIYLAFGSENLHLILLFLVLTVLAIWAAIRYTVGMGAYGYRGLGDVFVFLFFGLLGVYGSYALHQHHTFEGLILLPAAAIGLMSVAVLNLNNLRDRQNDQQAGKITLAIRLGNYAVHYQTVCMLLPWVLGLIFLFLKQVSLWKFAIYFALLFPFVFLLFKVLQTKTDSGYDKFLRLQALLTLLFALVLAVLTNC